MQRLISGALAGLTATVPMTMAMIAMHRELPAHQRHPLPPRKITTRALGAIGVLHHLNDRQRTGLTLLAHFGYGAFAGGLFGAVAPRELSKSIPAGIGFGLLVWAGSYLGFLPAVGLHRPATREPEQRNALMIAAHIVWGAAAGALAPLLRGH